MEDLNIIMLNQTEKGTGDHTIFTDDLFDRLKFQQHEIA